MLDEGTERERFEARLRSMLYEGEVFVEFEKTDGTRRKMRCTLKHDLMPAYEPTSGDKKKSRPVDPNHIIVWDLDAKGFRKVPLGDRFITYSID